MKAIIQRVSTAKVEVNGSNAGEINLGLLVLVGIEKNDDASSLEKMTHKLLNYRVFDDDRGKLNLNVQQVDGSLLVVSQFTVVADTSKGLRPGFSQGASPAHGEKIYNALVERMMQGYSKIETGRFAADMQVCLVNDGPVTFLLEV